MGGSGPESGEKPVQPEGDDKAKKDPLAEVTDSTESLLSVIPKPLENDNKEAKANDGENKDEKKSEENKVGGLLKNITEPEKPNDEAGAELKGKKGDEKDDKKEDENVVKNEWENLKKSAKDFDFSGQSDAEVAGKAFAKLIEDLFGALKVGVTAVTNPNDSIDMAKEKSKEAKNEFFGGINDNIDDGKELLERFKSDDPKKENPKIDAMQGFLDKLKEPVEDRLQKINETDEQKADRKASKAEAKDEKASISLGGEESKPEIKAGEKPLAAVTDLVSAAAKPEANPLEQKGMASAAPSGAEKKEEKKAEASSPIPGMPDPSVLTKPLTDALPGGAEKKEDKKETKGNDDPLGGILDLGKNLINKAIDVVKPEGSEKGNEKGNKEAPEGFKRATKLLAQHKDDINSPTNVSENLSKELSSMSSNIKKNITPGEDNTEKLGLSLNAAQKSLEVQQSANQFALTPQSGKQAVEQTKNAAENISNVNNGLLSAFKEKEQNAPSVKEQAQSQGASGGPKLPPVTGITTEAKPADAKVSDPLPAQSGAKKMG